MNEHNYRIEVDSGAYGRANEHMWERRGIAKLWRNEWYFHPDGF